MLDVAGGIILVCALVSLLQPTGLELYDWHVRALARACVAGLRPSLRWPEHRRPATMAGELGAAVDQMSDELFCGNILGSHCPPGRHLRSPQGNVQGR